MNTAHDHEAWPPDRGSVGPREGAAAPIDWADLRARLFAGHGVSGILSGDRSANHLRRRGSFDEDAAVRLISYEELSRSVNPDVSSNGKPGSGKVPPVADLSSTGGRGRE